MLPLVVDDPLNVPTHDPEQKKKDEERRKQALTSIPKWLFVKCPPSTTSDDHLSHMAVRVLMAMWRWSSYDTDPEPHRTWASQYLLAATANVRREHMPKYLKQLEDAGNIMREGRLNNNDPKSPVKWRLLLQSELTGRAEEVEKVRDVPPEAMHLTSADMHLTGASTCTQDVQGHAPDGCIEIEVPEEERIEEE